MSSSGTLLWCCCSCGHRRHCRSRRRRDACEGAHFLRLARAIDAVGRELRPGALEGPVVDDPQRLVAVNRARGFGYDRLHRLVEETRAPEPEAPYLSQHKSLQWNLDMLGNWNSLVRDADEDGSFTDYEGDNHTDGRTHNAGNEIESNGLVSDPNFDREVLSGSSPAVSRFHQHRYDSAGNMTDQRSGNSCQSARA